MSDDKGSDHSRKELHMFNFIQRLLRKKNLAPSSSTDVDDIEFFFTNAEASLQAFDILINQQNPLKRVLVVHGIGGVGKSTVLKMYRLVCRRKGIPVTITSGEESNSPLDVLSNWATELSEFNVNLGEFQRKYARYNAIRMAIETESEKIRRSAERVVATKRAPTTKTQKVGKLAAKATVEAAVGLVPVIGALAAPFAGAGTSALFDWLSDFLPEEELTLYTDPNSELTKAFIKDLNGKQAKEKIVLMIDTYEKIVTFDSWICRLAKQLPDSVLIVIAGRKTPSWNQCWPSWLSKTNIIEQKEMSLNNIKILANRYYEFTLGQTLDSQQVEMIAEFTRGLPLAATTVVQLWSKYQDSMNDFQSVKPQVVADLADRLLETVPIELKPAFEVAAILRHFNIEMLEAILKAKDIDKIYNELRLWPFMRPNVHGLSMHDSMREVINDALQLNKPGWYCAVHKSIIKIYHSRFPDDFSQIILSSEKTERTALVEFLYHSIVVDDTTALDQIKDVFDAALQFHEINLCNEILVLLNNVPQPSLELRQWTQYLSLQLTQANSSWEYALEGLEQLLQESLNPELEIKVRSNLGITLNYLARRKQAIEQLSKAFKLAKTWTPDDIPTQITILLRLADEGRLVGYKEGEKILLKAVTLARNNHDDKLLTEALTALAFLYGRHDFHAKSEPILREIVQLAERSGSKRELGLAYIRLGIHLVSHKREFSEEALLYLERAVKLCDETGDIQSVALAQRQIGLLLIGKNDAYNAKRYLLESVENYKLRKATRGLFRAQVSLCKCLLMLDDHNLLEELLPDVNKLCLIVSISDWTARWRIIQGSYEVVKIQKRQADSISMAISYFEEALIKSISTRRCSLIYEITNDIAKNIIELKNNGKSEEALLLAERLVKMWSRKSKNSEHSYKTVEMEECSPGMCQ
jgi:tetratricopeptide (TPR) repeat protein